MNELDKLHLVKQVARKLVRERLIKKYRVKRDIIKLQFEDSKAVISFDYFLDRYVD